MVDDSLDRLRAALAEARAIYDGEAETMDSECGPVAGVANAVFAIDEYLRAVRVPEQERTPLIALLGALRDHARGKPHPLLAVAKKEGRRGHSADNAWRAYVAAGVTMLVKAGDRKTNAIATVAKRLGVRKSTVESWHREISTGRHGDSGTTTLYKNMLLLGDETFRDNPRQAADTLLDILPTQKL